MIVSNSAYLHNLSLTGSVIILDEAHNIMKTCEESASVTLETQDLAVAIQGNYSMAMK